MLNNNSSSLFLLLTVLAMVSSQGPPSKVITVTNGATEGEWGSLERCPPGSKAVAYQTRNELATPFFDDTALNTIILMCDDENFSNVTSTAGFSGDFQRIQSCPSASVAAYMTSFSLRVQLPFNGTDTTQGDKTAANNIRFLCSTGEVINGVGNTDGVWGDYSESCSQGICGMETRIQPFDGGIGHYDNTALNDVRFTCCPEPPTTISQTSTTPAK